MSDRFIVFKRVKGIRKPLRLENSEHNAMAVANSLQRVHWSEDISYARIRGQVASVARAMMDRPEADTRLRMVNWSDQDHDDYELYARYLHNSQAASRGSNR